MNLKEIREMINLMNEHDLTEMEIEREGQKIKLKKASAEMPAVVANVPPTYRPPAEAPAAGASPAQEGGASDPNAKEIKSPMVGTFYRAPSPEAPPFAEVGQTVEVGQVVCIVEAMKLMNEIKSEVKGKITEILVDNAQPVEFGQALFIVEPA